MLPNAAKCCQIHESNSPPRRPNLPNLPWPKLRQPRLRFSWPFPPHEANRVSHAAAIAVCTPHCLHKCTTAHGPGRHEFVKAQMVARTAEHQKLYKAQEIRFGFLSVSPPVFPGFLLLFPPKPFPIPGPGPGTSCVHAAYCQAHSLRLVCVVQKNR